MFPVSHNKRRDFIYKIILNVSSILFLTNFHGLLEGERGFLFYSDENPVDKNLPQVFKRRLGVKIARHLAFFYTSFTCVTDLFLTDQSIIPDVQDFS